MKHLLSGESYALTQAKVFDMRWSSIASERTEQNFGMHVNNGPPAGCTRK